MTHPTGEPSIWERVAGAVGAVVVASAIGYMVWYGLLRPSGPPVVTVHLVSISSTEAGYLVRFRASNVGHSTAAEVRVIGQITSPKLNEQSLAVIDYIPQQSQREGGLYFTLDPSHNPLTLRAEGYADP
jgi:uncharacterized protein (TIGR02588 family)